MKILLLLTVLAFAISCGNTSQNKTIEEKKSVAEVSKDTQKTPCDLINEGTIKKILSIPENTPTEVKDVMRTHPTCFYKWETIQFKDVMTVGGNEISIDYPTEVVLVLVNKATPQMFERSIKVYRDGKSENGIGDMAAWGGRMSQLSFLAKDYLVHLHVKKSSKEQENKKAAKQIATHIIDNL